MRPEFESIRGIRWRDDSVGMPAIRIERDGVVGEVYLHGAHVTSWKPSTQREDVLFLSPSSHFKPDKAIRGGVPICFPWFGPKQGLPQHGFARTRAWVLDGISEANDGVVVELSGRSDERSRQLWPFDFEAKHRITFGNTLRMELEIQNSGKESFQFEEAQHTYFRVSDVREISISGLEDTTYLDQTQSGESLIQKGAIKFMDEVDRAYSDTNHSIIITDPSLKRRITVAKTNSNSKSMTKPNASKP